jgi:hypothetical protein
MRLFGLNKPQNGASHDRPVVQHQHDPDLIGSSRGAHAPQRGDLAVAGVGVIIIALIAAGLVGAALWRRAINERLDRMLDETLGAERGRELPHYPIADELRAFREGGAL